MIKYNNSNINDWFYVTDNIIKVYRNNAVCYYKIETSPTPEPQYRTISGETYCSGQTGYDKYVDVYSQVSYDGGITWETTATTATLVEADSPDCKPYTQLSYVERTNDYKGSIDLGLDVKVNFKAEISINVTSINGGNFFGDRTTTSDKNDFRFFAASNKPYFDIGSSRAYINITNSFITGVTYTVTLENFKLTVVGNGYTRNQTGTTQASSVVEQFHWYLFKGIATNGDCAKVYYFKIWNGNTLVGDFIPVRRNSDNVITMYNKVTNTFCDVLGTLTGG